MPCCVWRACCGVRAVMIAQLAAVQVAAVRVVLRVCGTCVFVCCVGVCDVAWVACWRVHVLGDTRHDADVPVWCVGLVASWVSVRARVRGDGSGERGAGRHVREVCVRTARM